jgi:hypothetical protein
MFQFYAKLKSNCFFVGFCIDKTLSYFVLPLYFYLSLLSNVKHITGNAQIKHPMLSKDALRFAAAKFSRGHRNHL